MECPCVGEGTVVVVLEMSSDEKWLRVASR